jgi:hypothetical protein
MSVCFGRLIGSLESGVHETELPSKHRAVPEDVAGPGFAGGGNETVWETQTVEEYVAGKDYKGGGCGGRVCEGRVVADGGEDEDPVLAGFLV